MAFNTIATIGILLLATTASARPSSSSSTSSTPMSNWQEDPYQDGHQGNAGARGMVCKKSLDAIHKFAADMMGKAIKSTSMDEYPIDIAGYGKLTIKAPRVTESKFGKSSFNMLPPNNIESQFHDGKISANGVWQVKPNNGDTSGGTYKIEINDAMINVTDQLLRGNDARPLVKVRDCMADISNFRVEVQGSSPGEMRTAMFSARATSNNDNQSLVIDQCDTEMCFEVLAHFEEQICRLWRGFVDEVINKELQQIPTKMPIHGDHYRIDYSLLQRGEPSVNDSSECINAGMEGKYMWRNANGAPFSPASMEWSNNRDGMYSFQLSDYTFNTLFHQAHSSGHRFCASDVMSSQSSSSSTPAPSKPSKPSPTPKHDQDQDASSLSLNCEDDADDDEMEGKADSSKTSAKSTSTRSTSTPKSSTTKSTRTSKSSSTKTSPTSKSSSKSSSTKTSPTSKSSSTKTSPTSKSSTTKSSTTKSTRTSKSTTTKSTSSASTSTPESSPSTTHGPRKARPSKSTKSSTTKSSSTKTSPTSKSSPTSRSSSTKTSPTSKSSSTKTSPTSRSSSTKTSPTSKSSTTKSTTPKSSSTRQSGKPRRGPNEKPTSPKKCLGSLFANISNYGPYEAKDMGDVVFKSERPIAVFLQSDKSGYFDASHGVLEFYGAIKGGLNGQRPLLARANIKSMRGQFVPKLNNANITGMFKLDNLELSQSRLRSSSSEGFDLEAAAEFSKPWIERSLNAFLERYAQFPVPLPAKYECASPSMTVLPRTVQLECEVRQQCQPQPTCRCFRDSCVCSEPCDPKTQAKSLKRGKGVYKRRH